MACPPVLLLDRKGKGALAAYGSRFLSCERQTRKNYDESRRVYNPLERSNRTRSERVEAKSLGPSSHAAAQNPACGGAPSGMVRALSTKLVRPIRFFMTAGQVSHYTGAAALLGSLPSTQWIGTSDEPTTFVVT